jgi:hypothetical protein
MADDGRRWSTEGELDPDLTEEAGYAGWEPPERRWWPLLRWVVTMGLLLVLAGGAVLVVLR